jgi:signal peptidase II
MVNGAKRPLFWLVVMAVVVLDVFTKWLAVRMLRPGVPEPVLGDWLLFKLVYNPGAAFGLYVGPSSRWVFMALAFVALIVLGSMVIHTRADQWVRLISLGLVCGGALGNLIDRVRSSVGVVDFIDVWIGPLNWPTFNFADMAVTSGAVVLAALLWFEGREHEGATATGSADAAEA